MRGQPPVPLRIRATRHGPVISDLVGSVDGSSGEVLALAWPALREDDVTVESGFDLAVARNAEEARAALRHLSAPEQNVGFADRAVTRAFLPPASCRSARRAMDACLCPAGPASMTGPASSPSTSCPRPWTRPPASSSTPTTAWSAPTTPTRSRSTGRPALRARRLEELLGDAKGVTLDRARAVQLDIVSTLAKDFLPFLLAVQPADAEERAILDGLGRWDRVTSAASGGSRWSSPHGTRRWRPASMPTSSAPSSRPIGACGRIFSIAC